MNRSEPDAAEAILLRSPIAHGRIVHCDVAQARSLPGVLDVITGEDVRSAGLQPMPCLPELQSADGRPLFKPPRPILAQDRVRHVGDPIAMIVAETVNQARDAAEHVGLELDELAVGIDPAAMVQPDAPTIWPDCPGNVALDWQAGDRQAAEQAFNDAAHVTELRLVNNRLAMMPMETRAALGAFDADTGRYTLWSPTQGVHRIREVMAAVLGEEESRLRVITEDVGGGFGLKQMAFAEQALVLFAAQRIGRPVRWIADRTEAFISDNAGRDHVSEFKLALDGDGRMCALAVDTIANMGAYLSTSAPFMPTLVFGRVMGGVYAIPAVHIRTRCVFTNTPPVDAYRGAGVPEAIFGLERTIDIAAAELGNDSIALRRRNLLDASRFPWSTPAGFAIDSGDFCGVLDKALTLADWDGFEVRRRQSAERGRLRGRGLAFYVHGTGGSTAETARVRMRTNGRVVVDSGTQCGGQDHAAMLADLAAESLGIAPEHIEARQGDSDLLPRGGGTGGSGSLTVAGRAATDAIAAMVEVMRGRAAAMFECAPADVHFSDGQFTVVGTDRSISLQEVAAEQRGGCTGEADFAGDHRTYPNGVYVCEVEVDPDTGHAEIVSFRCVDDLGRIVHPERADGQIMGGVVQGIGQALL
ncbi:MAG: xanthine dehydrogenase family protein molybdopterin-binding subunit, partial [Pseudomonadota bacterium]